MVPTFFVGVITFVFILLLFQVLQLTDTLLRHNVGIRNLIHILSYMSISFLPAILPMSLIFAIILSYNRLTADSEIIAMKSLGFSMWPIITPGICLGIVISIFSGYTSFKIGPWGNRQFEIMIHDIINSKIISQMKEGTFSDDFFNLVIYANKINDDTKELEDVFIYDERDRHNPTTIISKKGVVVSKKNLNSYKASVKLSDGDIHKISKEGHTKIKFGEHTFQIIEPKNKKTRNKSMESLTYEDLKKLLATVKDPKSLKQYIYEWHKRFTLSFACILFVLLGVGLGCRTQSRSGKSGGGVISVLVIVSYWLLFVIGSSLTKSTALPAWVCAWLPVIILLPVSFFFLQRNWN